MRMLSVDTSSSLMKQEDIQDVVHWLRQIIALIVGIIWGLVGMKGIAGLFG